MAVLTDGDVFAGASQHAMREHLTPPLRAGAVELPLAIDASGFVTMATTSREPLVLAWPLAALENETLLLGVKHHNPPTGTPPLDVELEFAPYTEAGAALPVHRPPADPTSHLADAFALELTLARRPADGTPAPIAAASIGTWVAIGLLEGLTGRLLYLMGAEKPRVRRAGRELAAQRRLARARDHALDRAGADVGVARFGDQLSFSGGEVVSAERREPDAEYRRRLALYRPFLMPSRGRILEQLNGPGAAADPNAGPLSELGVSARFGLAETANPISLAIHLVASGGNDPANRRTALLDAIRRIHLIWPAANSPSGAAHNARFLAAPIRQQQTDLRVGVRAAVSFGSGVGTTPALAPMLASALARVGELRTALGGAAPLTLTRAQDSGAGSRYELGLGVDVDAMTGAELTQLANAASNIDPSTIADPELRALVASLEPRTAVDDPDGAWLLEACGLRTVFRVTGNTLYLSHLPTRGLVIDAPDTAAPGAAVPIEARDAAPGDSASDATLAAALSAALGAWPGPAPTTLSPTAAQTAWAAAAPRASGDRALDVFAAAGLPAVADPRAAAQRLARLPAELVRTLQLANAQSGRVLGTGSASTAATELAGQVKALRDNGIASVLPLVSGTNVLLVVSVIGLPEAGVNLAARRGINFRWFQVPIQGSGGEIGGQASRTTFRPYGEGITAIVCAAYRRTELVDPYEYSVELPATELIGLGAYEFLMNLLDRTHPLGVQVNTWSLRREHVDLAGGGTATPLDPHVSRTYRRFQRRHQRGAGAAPPES